jgi:hypothetical protein
MPMTEKLAGTAFTSMCVLDVSFSRFAFRCCLSGHGPIPVINDDDEMKGSSTVIDIVATSYKR